MHVFAATDDRVDGTSLDTFGTANAFGLNDDGHQSGMGLPAGAVVGQRRNPKKPCECPGAVVTARRAAVHFRSAGGQGFRVRPTSRKPALAALRLGQQSINPLDHLVVTVHFTGIPGSAPASTPRRCRPAPSFPAERIIPSLTPKRILRGARLAMNTTLRPRSDSGVA